MKSVLMWGVKGPAEMTYSGSNKAEKMTLVYPDSLGTKPEANRWAKEHGESTSSVVRVKVVY
jgi:hypothetical protein